jgi:hypothetical protein
VHGPSFPLRNRSSSALGEKPGKKRLRKTTRPFIESPMAVTNPGKQHAESLNAIIRE